LVNVNVAVFVGVNVLVGEGVTVWYVLVPAYRLACGMATSEPPGTVQYNWATALWVLS
jgi:hypothetical protein